MQSNYKLSLSWFANCFSQSRPCFYTFLTLCKTPPVAEFTDICRTIRHAVKLFSSLFFPFCTKPQSVVTQSSLKNSALQRMRCVPRCVRHAKRTGASLLACNAVSSHSMSFLVIINKHVGFWTSKWGHKCLSRGVVGPSAASSSAISSCQPRHTLPALLLHCSVPLPVIRQRISTRFLLLYKQQCCSV